MRLMPVKPAKMPRLTYPYVLQMITSQFTLPTHMLLPLPIRLRRILKVLISFTDMVLKMSKTRLKTSVAVSVSYSMRMTYIPYQLSCLWAAKQYFSHVNTNYGILSISNHYEEQEMNLNLAIYDDEIKDIELLKKHILQYTIETDNNITVSSYTSAKN